MASRPSCRRQLHNAVSRYVVPTCCFRNKYFQLIVIIVLTSFLFTIYSYIVNKVLEKNGKIKYARGAYKLTSESVDDTLHHNSLSVKATTTTTTTQTSSSPSAVSLSGKIIPFFPPNSPQYPFSINDNAYYIRNPNICRTASNLTVLVLVQSATTHFSRRSSLRKTWANKDILKRHELRIVFLLGQPEAYPTQALIENENSLFGDIVQGNFRDSYHNLTHKAVLGVRWVVENCRNARTIVKADDDVFVNVFQLISNIEKDYSNKARSIFCKVRKKGTALVDRAGKWNVESDYFPTFRHYPFSYCLGFFVILTADMFPELFEAARQTPFFWIDDVYLFGILITRIGKVDYHHISQANQKEPPSIECFESSNQTCNLLAATAKTEGVMHKMWNYTITRHQDLVKKYSNEQMIGV